MRMCLVEVQCLIVFLLSLDFYEFLDKISGFRGDVRPSVGKSRGNSAWRILASRNWSLFRLK